MSRSWARATSLGGHTFLTLKTFRTPAFAPSFPTRASAVRATPIASAQPIALPITNRSCNDPEVDLVFITNRNQYHGPQALEALRAGKHVFVEKPMALTEEECKDLVHASKESGCQLTVGFNRRFAPLYKPLKAQLAKRKSPAVISCRVNSPGIAGPYWMADPAVGGAILGEACHFVDLMYWLLDSEPVSVSAYSLPTGKQDPVGENNMVASFLFADGSIGNLTYCTIGSRTSGGELVEVFMHGMGIKSEDFKRLTTAGFIRRTQKKMFAEKGYDAQLEEFVKDLRGGKTASVTVRDGARSTIGCLRMMQSAKERNPVSMDWESVVS